MSDFDPKAYWENRLSRDFTPGGVGYLGLGRNYNRWLYRVRRRVFLRMMRQVDMTWSACRVLDVGSGTGFYVALWRELGAQSVTGSDLTSVAVERLARCCPGNEFVQMDIGADVNCLAGRQFDVVSAFDVLFHVVDDGRYRQAMVNLSGLLRPGGLLVFSDYFLHGAELRAAHEVRRTLSSVEQCLAKAGLEVVSRVPMFVLMNFPADSSSRLLHNLWNRKARWLEKSEPLGWLAGAALYPLELAALRFFKEGPSTEAMICRKRPEAAECPLPAGGRSR